MVSQGSRTSPATCAAKDVAFQSSDDDVPGHFTPLYKKSLQLSPGLQSESHVLQQPLSMQFFKLVINSGWHSFAGVRKCAFSTTHMATLTLISRTKQCSSGLTTDAEWLWVQDLYLWKVKLASTLGKEVCCSWAYQRPTVDKVLAGASINCSDDGTIRYASPGIANLAPYSVGYLKCMSRSPASVISELQPSSRTPSLRMTLWHV